MSLSLSALLMTKCPSKISLKLERILTECVSNISVKKWELISQFVFEWTYFLYEITSHNWAVVVAKLVERLLPISEVHCSNPFIGKNVYWTFYCQLCWKDENKEKETGKAHFLKKPSHNLIVLIATPTLVTSIGSPILIDTKHKILYGLLPASLPKNRRF